MIGKKLKELRMRSGESLQDVATAVGSSKPHIWELEQGRATKPSFELVKNLAAHFRVSIDEFKDEPTEQGSLVFGHHFINATEDQKQMIVDIAAKLIKSPEDNVE